MTAYAELQTTTNFSFLRGASRAEELMLTAEALGISVPTIVRETRLAEAWLARDLTAGPTPPPND